jgi:hypothetical protein
MRVMPKYRGQKKNISTHVKAHLYGPGGRSR